MQIGDKIKQRRTELKWSQRELAKRMNYTDHTTITRIENGKVDVSQSRIVQFAEVLGVSVAYLMGWEEVQKNNDTITDAVVRMRSDDDFLSLVENLLEMNPEEINRVKQLVSIAFQK